MPFRGAQWPRRDPAVLCGEAVRAHGSADAEWAARRHGLSELGEYAVIQPYAGLPGADELDELTDRYWEAAELDNWGDKLDAYLREQVLVLTAP